MSIIECFRSRVPCVIQFNFCRHWSCMHNPNDKQHVHVRQILVCDFLELCIFVSVIGRINESMLWLRTPNITLEKNRCKQRKTETERKSKDEWHNQSQRDRLLCREEEKMVKRDYWYQCKNICSTFYTCASDRKVQWEWGGAPKIYRKFKFNCLENKHVWSQLIT